MSQSIDVRPSHTGSADQSFLSLDDGFTSPLASPSDRTPNSSLAVERSTSPRSIGAHSFGSPRNAYDGGEFGDLDANGDSSSVRRKKRRSPSLSSPQVRSSRRSILEGTCYVLASPDTANHAEPVSARDGPSSISSNTSTPQRVSTATGTINTSVGARIGAFMSRSTKSSEERPAKQSDPPAVNPQAHSETSASSWAPPVPSTSSHSQPANETNAGQSLASRFLRSKSSRQKLEDFGEAPGVRRESNGLGSAFGLRKDSLRAEQADPSSSRLGMLADDAEGSPSTAADYEASFAALSQSGVSSRPSSRANILEMASSSASASSGRTANGGPLTRGGRLGRLQYKKSEGVSVGREVAGSLRGRDLMPSKQGNYAVDADREAWQRRIQDENREWIRSRLPSSAHYDQTTAANRNGSAALAGLGIEAKLDDEASMDDEASSSRARSSAAMGGPATVESRRRDTEQANAFGSIGRSGFSSQYISASYQTDESSRGLGGPSWSEGRERGHAYKISNSSQPIEAGRAASRASVQDKFHNRFSKQTTSDGSRHSTRSSAHSRDAFSRGVGEISPPLEANVSPVIAQQQQRHHQHQPSLSESETRWSPKDQARDSSGSRPGVAAISPILRSASPPVGGLSDSAIIAMGAVPGSHPESLLNANGAPLSSKNVLTIALQKAQSAVQLDSANHVAEAIAAYRQAVRLLDEVMARIAPKHGRKSRPSREEERRRLRVIHDTYADRIRLLSPICAPEDLGYSIGDDSSYDQSQVDAGPTLEAEERGRTEHLYTEQRQESVQDGDQSFLLMTPVAERHDTSTMERYMGKRSDEASHLFLRSPEMGSSQGRGAFSVADEQGGAAPPPQISIQPRLDANDSQEILLDLQVSATSDGALHRHNGHDRSDSDSSFHSTRTKGNVGSSVKPRQRDSPRSLGLNEEESRVAITPTTPFDAADAAAGLDEDVSAHADGPLGDRDAKVSLSGASMAAEERRRLAHAVIGDLTAPATRRGQPALKAKGSMPSLGMVRDAAAKADAARSMVQARPSSAAIELGTLAAAPFQQVDDDSHFGRESLVSTQRLVVRPRAATLVARRIQPGPIAHEALVSSTTATGTISQRRKQVQPQMPALPNPLPSDLTTRAKAAESSSNGSLPVSYSRQRATSQPNSRRPSIPAAFLAAGAGADLAPPVPKLAQTLSGGLDEANLANRGDDGDAASSNVLASATPAAPLMPQRKSSAVAAVQQPTTSLVDHAKSRDQAHAALRDVFPSGLPSLAFGTPSYATGTSEVGQFPWLGLTSKLSDPLSTPQMPLQAVLRPFHVMRMLLQSIQRGGYVTQRLYVPKGLWLQQGARLISIEHKVRALELISTGLEAVAKGGEALLKPTGTVSGVETSNGSKFAKHLDELDALMIEAQNSLAKKLGYLETVTGKKAATSFGVFGSKLTRSLDRMTTGRNLNSPVIYVEALARLFSRAHALELHLVCLLRSQGAPNVSAPLTAEALPSNAYDALPVELRDSIETRLKRSSDFFANVILAFVLRDVGVLLDKFAKRGSLVFTE